MNLVHTIGANQECALISAGKTTHTVSPLLEMTNVFVCFAVAARKDTSGGNAEEDILIASLHGGLLFM